MEGIDKNKNNKNVDFFGTISNTFDDMYEGKGSFGELAKSRENKINKIKDEIFCILYGDSYKDKKKKKVTIKSKNKYKLKFFN